jgi:hypothetical protein
MADAARWFRTRVADPLQLAMDWFGGAGSATETVAPRRAPQPDVGAQPSPAPRASSRAEQLHDRLQALGLRGVSQVTLRRTRRVMVSVRAGRLTVHTDFANAPDEILLAIVRFVMSRRRVDRLAAQRVILDYEVTRAPARRRVSSMRPADTGAVQRLRQAHREFNAAHFGGALGDVPISVSGRMKTRLGQYTPVQDGIDVAEIAIGRRHIRRDPWDDVLHTLLHEMVHQWQDESGLPVDHGVAFRRKAREVGVLPRAKRPLRR